MNMQKLTQKSLSALQQAQSVAMENGNSELATGTPVVRFA